MYHDTDAKVSCLAKSKMGGGSVAKEERKEEGGRKGREEISQQDGRCSDGIVVHNSC